MKTQDLVDQILQAFINGRLRLLVQPDELGSGWLISVQKVVRNEYLAPEVAGAFMDMWASEVNRPLETWEA